MKITGQIVACGPVLARTCFDLRPTAALLLCLLLLPVPLRAAEEFSFDVAAFEKKPLEWGGYLELKGEHSDINQDGAMGRLNLYRQPRATLDRLGGTVQLDGRYQQGIATANWLLRASAAQDDLAWHDQADIFAAYLSLENSPQITIDLGKKVFKWGKGYAWNPVGFIDRPKDPDDPEEAMEGFVGAGLDLVRSFAEGPLKSAALTTVALPVWQGVNEEFGERDNLNFAAKLYLLLHDTDLDFILFSGNSRTPRYGLDFSRNLAPNLEIHGELAHTPRQPVRLLLADNSVAKLEVSDTSWLLGLRYLSARELTTIVEYYHNGDGYSEEELGRFFNLVADGHQQFTTSGATTLLDKAAKASQPYSRPQAGRNYLYLRLSQKEPFDLLYFNPGLTTIVNLADQSWSLSPEALYTGFTNWELRLRFTALNGGNADEYGNKQNRNKLEARLRYFF